jgi:23S rRNA G2445 N2-methylase RlmL
MFKAVAEKLSMLNGDTKNKKNIHFKFLNMQIIICLDGDNSLTEIAEENIQFKDKDKAIEILQSEIQ